MMEEKMSLCLHFLLECNSLSLPRTQMNLLYLKSWITKDFPVTVLWFKLMNLSQARWIVIVIFTYPFVLILENVTNTGMPFKFAVTAVFLWLVCFGGEAIFPTIANLIDMT